jgi:DNA-repair protein complementing XP-A cells
MLLYLRKQVEAFAWSKWGSAEKLDKEFQRREEQTQERKDKKVS